MDEGRRMTVCMNHNGFTGDSDHCPTCNPGRPSHEVVHDIANLYEKDGTPRIAGHLRACANAYEAALLQRDLRSPRDQHDHGAGLAEGDNDTTVVQTPQLSHDDAWHPDPSFKEGGWFDEEMALSQLLADGVLFPNSFRIVRDAWDHTNSDGSVAHFHRYESKNETVTLFVSLSDWFSYSTADSEEFGSGSVCIFGSRFMHN